MQLYHVTTTYHLLSAITIHATTNKEAVLLMASWIKNKYPNYQELKKLFGFQDIVVYDGDYRYKHSKEETATYFGNILPKVFSFEKIYIWGAQYAFGAFCAENNIPFCFCEEASGLLSRHEILEHVDLKLEKGKTLFPYLYKLGLYDGNCASATDILCNKMAQLEGMSLEGKIHFNVVESLAMLAPDIREKIIGFFINIRRMEIPRNCTILFTQHLANLNLVTFEEQVLLYQILVDYFFEGRSIVIKPHPDDIIYYSKLFPEAQVVRERFPSEFLPFLVDNQPDCVATVYSTAVYNLRGQYPEVFELDSRYEKDFPKTHLYYIALYIARLMAMPIYYVGTNEVLMQKLGYKLNVTGRVINQLHNVDELPQITIIDDISSWGESGRNEVISFLDSSRENDVVLFINSRKDFCWYSYERKDIWKQIIPVDILKLPRNDMIAEDFFEKIGRETIYFYSKNKLLQKEVRKMMIEKDLPHVGIDVKKLPIDDEKEHIRVLEGVLEATEQRLLYYIERVKELENR